jgi:putative phosphoesterase
MGFELRGDFAEVEGEGLKLALIHGTHPPLINALAKSGEYGVVVHGHTHMPREERVGGALIVNPGEVCGYITGKRTLALLDTASGRVEFLEL